ncbi:aminoglycoside phosphotransferase family protein [Bacillus solimangrovi]|uniref:Aminoglycoside phosphotransferase domain-containing protein n=1 Tax=Bacillus solimangrovi TaxID=1305675 RepID=A0A1E5LAN8_9BACI|nr:aminoglycoside phosphotransferase family protein [Bacillus solimangrovi]OEH91154.1 hypothetical protein BFG57_07250 [Bacillus solimangrovi]
MDINLTNALADLTITSISKVSEGLESDVYKVYSSTYEQFLVVKVPKQIVYHNENDQDLSAKGLYMQDYLISEHLIRNGFSKVPRVFDLKEIDGCPILIQEYVEGDNAEFHEGEYDEFGQELKKIHDMPLPDFKLIAQEGQEDVNNTIIERIFKRIVAMNKLAGTDIHLPSKDVLTNVLKNGSNKKSLLHMDLRAENILRKNHNILVFIDWSNALIGDPLLEFARANEYGLPVENILSGYGEYPLTSTAQELIYRLDTAIMLGIVFLSSAPNKLRAEQQINRVKQLNDRLIEKI